MPGETPEASSEGAGEPRSSPTPLRLMPAGWAFVVALAWIAIGVVAIGHHLRPSRSTVAVFYALFLGCPLAWIAYTGWRNRRFFADASPARRMAGALRMLAQPLVWFVCCGIPVGIAMSTYGGYTPRARTAELVLGGSKFKNSIADAIREKRRLEGSGAGIAVEPAGRVTAGMVAQDGTIVLYDGALRVLVYLVPELAADGRIEWTCDGMPAIHFPAQCRRPEETSYVARDTGSAAEDARELLQRARAWQDAVTERSLAQPASTRREKTTIVRREGLVDFGLMDTDGRIALYSDRHGVFVLLEPRLVSGHVTWSCRVWPRAAAPASCSAPP